jgi:hypothetical protein
LSIESGTQGGRVGRDRSKMTLLDVGF